MRGVLSRVLALAGARLAKLSRVLVLIPLTLLVIAMAPPPALPVEAHDHPAVEVLRLRVPREGREAWLRAERLTWEPWLQGQPAFLRRDLLWDPEAEEGLLLIHWASRDQWKRIRAREVEEVQERFEREARRVLEAAEAVEGEAAGGRRGRWDTNPFPLLSSRELQPMGHSARSEAPAGPSDAGPRDLQE